MFSAYAVGEALEAFVLHEHSPVCANSGKPATELRAIVGLGVFLSLECQMLQSFS